MKERGYFTLLLLLTTFLLTGQRILKERITLDSKNIEVNELLSFLRSEGFNLAYSSDMIPDESITLSSLNPTLQELFNQLRTDFGIKYRVNDNLIVLSHEPLAFTLSGYIKDSKSGEALIGATVFVGDSGNGTITNNYGFYSLTLPKGEYVVSFRYVGYQTIKQEISLRANNRYMVNLSEISEELEEVTVSGITPSFNIDNLIPGVNQINFGEDWPIPYFLGEQDIFQNSLTLPGIRSVGEDATGLNIRGGDIDQNLILFDEAPIYNPNHFYGLISVFNPEVTNNVEIMKGHIPAQYGGRASSVINIYQREGNNQEFHASGGIGIVSGRLAVEGPIKKNESSYLFSIRRSLLNFSIEDFVNSSLGDSRTNFQDINGKLNWNLNAKNRLFLSGYFGRDRNRAGFDAIRRWGNRSLSLRWNKIFNPRLFSNFTGIVSEYNYRIEDPQEVGSFIGTSFIRNYSAKADFGFLINPRNTLDFGLQTTLHRLLPGERQPFDEDASAIPIELDKEDALESAMYAAHHSELSRNLSIQYGLRVSSLHNMGPGDIFVYQSGVPKEDNTISDTLSYRSGQVFERKFNFEPRISLNVKLTNKQSIKASFSRTAQYIHLLSNTVSPSPTDIWKLSDRNIRPTLASHYSLGYYTNSNNEAWEFSAEVYYKNISNVIDFKDGADLLFNSNVETELLSGMGRSYGLELFIKKNIGDFRGWLSYTLSRAEQRFDSPYESLQINSGSFFPTDFDRLHDVTITSLYQWTSRLSVSATFNYNSGRPLTLPVGKFVFDNKIVPHFEDRNLHRLPEYSRLDLSLRLKGKAVRRSGDVRKNSDEWVLTLYNAYARKNIYSYFFRESEENPGETEAIPYSIFGTIIPSITYNFRF